MSEQKRYIRLARMDELEHMCQLAQRAFFDDPEFNYFGGRVKPLSEDRGSGRHDLEQFFGFLIKSSMLIDGRVTAAVLVPSSGEERITSFCVWLPPGKRLAIWRLWTIFRGGLIPGLRGWGFGGLMRVGIEYPNKCEGALAEAYKKKGLKQSHSTSWYLQLSCTDPADQGQGYMSLLMNDAFENAPNSVFTLEATTPKSRDHYAHHGFEVFKPIILGPGKVNERGLLPNAGEAASGVTIWSMIKWA